MKNQKIDVLTGVSPADFLNMSENEAYRSKFHFLSPVSYQFIFLGFNSRLLKLDFQLRQALSYLMPYEDIIDVAALGFGQRTIGPLNPADSVYYNSDLVQSEFNLERSENLMVEIGFQKKSGQWYDRYDEPLSLELSYQTGSAIFENTALILNDQLQKFGIDVELVGFDRSALFKKARSHDFELILTAFRGGPLAHNFAPILATEAALPGGLNFTGFGNQKSDRVINLINSTNEKMEKISAMKEFQKLLFEEKTMLFLLFEKDRIIVNKKFTNVYGFGRKPGFNVTKFQLANPN